ncbi:pentatricopeptide repeat-containing protein At3g58590 [Silene latifolia]|uniref:pentatricopeptide repeat-containing protein At3g58590 n=1 Tax=Silene latifolia TaxID=37657 RepID=UPI003D775155
MINFTIKRSSIFPISQLSSNLIRLQPFNVCPDAHLHNILDKFAQSRTLKALHAFHALNITLGPFTRQPIYFTNNVVSLYTGFDEIRVARKVFDEMPERNVVSYNTMISGYRRSGWVKGSWEVFCGMWGCGFRPNEFTFGGLLSCRGLELRKGCVVYGLVVKNGLFYGDPCVGTALIGLFGRHGCVDEAVRVFDDMPWKNLVTWNSIISLLGCHGCVEESMILFRELMRLQYVVSESTVVGLLSGFEGQEAVELGQQVHSLVIKNGLDFCVSASNAFINLYARCLDLSSAERMFEQVPFRDVVTYNTMIGTCVKSGSPDRGLELLLRVYSEGLLPNSTTYVEVINCCANMLTPAFGEYVHAKVMKKSIENDVFVGTALVDFYGKCDLLDSARRCFDEIRDISVVSWNCLIAAFTSRNHIMSTTLFQEMHRSGYCPNEITLSSVLKVCSLVEIQELHSFALRMGYTKNEYVYSSLITSYAKNGSVTEALVFAKSMETQLSVVSTNVIAAAYNRNRQYDKSLEILCFLDEPDMVSWNILVSTCSHNGQHSEAFDLFKHMLKSRLYPDNHTIVSILSSCASLRSLSLGSSIHGLLMKINFKHCDSFVCNILVDMYAKCGCLEDSMKIFNVTPNKNIITWTAAISALGHHGYAQKALEKFKEMELLGIKPDDVSFVAVLSACRHGGLVKEGMELFSRMNSSYGIEPKMDHYHGVVDLLARHGHLKEAEKVITSMPFPPNAVIWRSFLEGCKRWKARQQEKEDHCMVVQ